MLAGPLSPEDLDEAWWKAVSECDALALACMMEQGFEDPGRLNLMCCNAIGQVVSGCIADENRTRDLVEVLLLGGCPVDSPSPRAFPAMSLAARTQPLSIIRLLDESGARICDEAHGIYLMHESCANPDPLVAPYLADRGARMDLVRQSDQRSLLHAAIRSNHREMAARLIRQGVLLDHLDRHGNTAALLLAQNNDLPLLALALDAGASVQIRNRTGRSVKELVEQTPGSWDRLMGMIQAPR